MQTLDFEVIEDDYITECPYRKSYFIGSSACRRCTYHGTCLDTTQTVSCKHKKSEEKKTTKINLLIGLLDFLGSLKSHEGWSETMTVLQQAINSLNNPLGILPGDEIEMFNGERWSLHTLDYYDGDAPEPWVSGYNYFENARIPINVPVLTSGDVLFLRQFIKNRTLSQFDADTLKELLERTE